MRTNAFIGPNSQNLRGIRFLVDSGSFSTILPPALADELGIAATLTAPAILADSRVVQLRHGVAYLRIEDREGAVQVGVLDLPEPIMGVSALEALGFKIDPIRERLEVDRPYGPAIL